MTSPESPETPERRRGDQGDWRPRPDPTELTTEALDKAIKALDDLSTAKIQALAAVVAEKFVSIENHNRQTETQRVEQKKDTKDAVDAALAAAKEAVREQTIANNLAFSKSEAATTKQLDQLKVTFDTAIAGVTVLLADIKDRVGRVEENRIGGREVITDRRQQNASVYSLAAVLISLLILIGSVATAIIAKK